MWQKIPSRLLLVALLPCSSDAAASLPFLQDSQGCSPQLHLHKWGDCFFFSFSLHSLSSDNKIKCRLLSSQTYVCEWLERGDFKMAQGQEEPPESWKRMTSYQEGRPFSHLQVLFSSEVWAGVNGKGRRADSRISTLSSLCRCGWAQPPKASLKRLWLRKWNTRCLLLIIQSLGFNSGTTGKLPLAHHVLVAWEEPQGLLRRPLPCQLRVYHPVTSPRALPP